MIGIKAFSVIHCADEEGNWFLKSVPQEYTSENTSINKAKLPAVYNLIKLKPGSLVVDFGGGKWDTAVEHFAKEDITILVYDPYNRSAEHNKEVLRILRENGGADAAVNSNVLNVIKEPEARKNVLENIARITKPGAPIYITVYEGKGNGQEGPTKSGYQLNRKTADYLEEVQEVFPDATRKGKLIIAHNSGSVSSSIEVEGYTDIQDISRYDKDVVNYRKIISKPVEDNDGFITDYTMYEVVTEDGSVEYECYFGDNDIYGPWNGEGLDFEADNYDESVEWYNSYSSDENQSSESVEGSVTPEEFFTKDDLIDFVIEVVEKINDRINPKHQFNVKDAYLEGRNVYVSVGNDTYSLSGETIVDMRKIRKSADLKKYVNAIVNQMIEEYNEYSSVDLSTDIEGAFSNLEDEYLTPKDYPDPTSSEYDVDIEIDLNQQIKVDEDGSCDFVDTSNDFASSDGHGGSWYDDNGLYIADPSTVVEDLLDVLEPKMPIRPGVYDVTCIVTLVYEVSDIDVYQNFGKYEEDYEEDVDTSHATKTFSYDKSTVENFHAVPSK